MSDQNIYDNQEFFNGYYALRERDDCYNDLLEQPAMSEFVPDLQNKTVLDLGCGYGHNCMDFIRRGAKKVIGVDISQKMLNVARKESCDSKIEYINMSITEIDSLTETFDLVYSSLAFHYIEDFKKLIQDINHLLIKGGHLLYVYDEYFDQILCPNDKILTCSTTNRDGYREYKSNHNDCKICPKKVQCTESKACQ